MIAIVEELGGKIKPLILPLGCQGPIV